MNTVSIRRHFDNSTNRCLIKLLLLVTLIKSIYSYHSGNANKYTDGYFQKEMEYYTRLIELYTVNNVSVADFIARPNALTVRTVVVNAGLLALQDFNEVEGTLELMMHMRLRWFDDIIEASGYNISDLFPPNRAGVQTILVPFNHIWTPKLVLVNSVDSLDAMENPAYRPRFNITTGEVTWNPRVRVRSACSPDVTYYPFDRQTCDFDFVPWGHTPEELRFRIFPHEWDLGYFQENGEWGVISTDTTTYVKSNTPWLRLSITIERKPLYFAFNIILPILVLVVLNGMVFWLPVESGERIGFSVTCFLSFVVLLNMIMDILPRSSAPMSYLCYYTVCMMIFSGATTTIVILEMRLFHKPEKERVHRCVQAFVRFFQCRPRCCKPRRPSNAVEPEINTDKKKGTTFLAVDDDNDVTWPELTRFLDKYLFLTFIGGQIMFTILFMMPIAAKA